MKKLRKLLISLIVFALLISQNLSSFAWVSVTGEGGWSDKMEGEYRIQIKRQGWLIYWIDDTQTVRSDVMLVGELGVLNEFSTANYQCIKTRWQDKGVARSRSISDMDGMPKPYTQTLSGAKSNSAEMRTWIFNHGEELVDILNAPQEIKNCEEEDKYFFIAEPVYMFALFSPVQGVKCEYIVGTTYQYSNYIVKNLLGTPISPTFL